MTSRRTKISPKSGRGLGHVTPTIFGSTVGYPSDSLASCFISHWWLSVGCWRFCWQNLMCYHWQAHTEAVELLQQLGVKW